jgi:hypothetical protein
MAVGNLPVTEPHTEFHGYFNQGTLNHGSGLDLTPRRPASMQALLFPAP